MSLRSAVQEVAARDPIMARVIERVGPMRLPRATGDPLSSLIRDIVYQQLAGRAAASIHARLLSLFDGPPTPETLARLPTAALRGAGLSGAKAASLHDLAARTLDGTVPLQSLRRLDDLEVVRRLSQVRGIGTWTAEMFLIFELHRLDVWPVEDYGVRKGYARIYGLPGPPPPRELRSAGDRFSPFRTVAAWYCWRAPIG